MRHQISVVIPAYNREHMVGSAVSSAFCQTVPPREVVVVDDGSADRTAEVARAAGARVISKPNGGHSSARNLGLRAAESSWVALLDSDDEWLPHHLEALMPFLSRDIALVSANAVGVPSGRIVGHPFTRPRRIGHEAVMWPDNPLSPSTTIVDRDLALSVGGFPHVGFGEDRLFWLELLHHRPGLLVPLVTCRYREHVDQVSADKEVMRQARRELVADLVQQGRTTTRVAAKIETALTWDEAASHGEGPVRRVLTVARRPSSLAALVELAVYRFRLRLAARRLG